MLTSCGRCPHRATINLRNGRFGCQAAVCGRLKPMISTENAHFGPQKSMFSTESAHFGPQKSMFSTENADFGPRKSMFSTENADFGLRKSMFSVGIINCGGGVMGVGNVSIPFRRIRTALPKQR